jgi:hypothetical protein
MLATTPPAPTDPHFPEAEQAMARQIEARRAEDPLIGARVGSKLLYDQLVQLLQSDPRGVRAELLLGIPAMLAGYACQAATWESLVAGMGYPVDEVFMLASAADGAQYPFSDPLNHLLLEDRYSVWAWVAAAARAKTDQPLPDVTDIITHVVQSIGTPAFGQPRLPAPFKFADPPLATLRAAWPRFLPLLGLTCALPEEWPVLFALAIQQAMDAASSVVDPVTACVIAMECAVPMAHVPMSHVPMSPA